jgi:hypothetical protein
MATLFGAVLALAGWALELRPLRDNSFLLHLKTGHWILENGIPRGDIYSYTAPGTDWVAQSWLAEAFYGVIDSAFGPFGLRVMRAVIAVLVCFLAFRLAARLTRDRTRAMLLTFPALAASFTLWVERPLFLGVLAMVVLLWIVEVPDSFVGRHAKFTLPVLMWLWVNVHGSFALGFFYIGLHLGGRWLEGSKPWTGRERELTIAAAIALAACCLNPYGISLLTFPLELLSRGETLANVREWKSPDFHTLRGFLFGVWMVVFAVAAAVSRKRISRRDLLVSVPFMLLGLWALRNIAVAPLIGLAVVARTLAVDEEPADKRLALNWVVLAMLLLLGFTSAVEAAREDDYGLEGYPVEAMQVIEERGLLGQELLTSEAWGAYVIHEYWPRQHVFMDDRYDMYPIALIDDYFTLGAAGEGWDDILDRYGIDVVVWDVEKPLTQLLDLDQHWQRIHSDDLAAVWVRRPAGA